MHHLLVANAGVLAGEQLFAVPDQALEFRFTFVHLLVAHAGILAEERLGAAFRLNEQAEILVVLLLISNLLNIFVEFDTEFYRSK